jgi:hypothetical protein
MDMKAYFGMNSGKTVKIYIDAAGFMDENDISDLRELLLVTEKTNVRVTLKRKEYNDN